MRRGIDVPYPGTFFDGAWAGQADFVVLSPLLLDLPGAHAAAVVTGEDALPAGGVCDHRCVGGHVCGAASHPARRTDVDAGAGSISPTSNLLSNAYRSRLLISATSRRCQLELRPGDARDLRLVRLRLPVGIRLAGA